MRRLFIDPFIAVIPCQSDEGRWSPVRNRQSEKQGIEVDIAGRPADLEMKMRPLGTAGTAAPGDEVSFSDREKTG